MWDRWVQVMLTLLATTALFEVFETALSFQQELHESLEKLRPKLFRLASETEENDTEALSMLFYVSSSILCQIA